MATEEFAAFTVKDFRDYGYYVDANENMFVPIDGNITYTRFGIVTNIVEEGDAIVLESIPYDEPLSMFAAIEATRGYPADCVIAFRDYGSGPLVPVTNVQHDEIEREIRFF